MRAACCCRLCWTHRQRARKPPSGWQRCASSLANWPTRVAWARGRWMVLAYEIGGATLRGTALRCCRTFSPVVTSIAPARAFRRLVAPCVRSTRPTAACPGCRWPGSRQPGAMAFQAIYFRSVDWMRAASPWWSSSERSAVVRRPIGSCSRRMTSSGRERGEAERCGGRRTTRRRWDVARSNTCTESPRIRCGPRWRCHCLRPAATGIARLPPVW
jgi:hypothetical protein